MLNNFVALPIEDFLGSENWTIAKRLQIPAREKALVSSSDLGLSAQTERYLTKHFPDGLYRHQHAAIQMYQGRSNVCMLTGTASGKSLLFYAAAIEELTRDVRNRVLALYPLKALGAEQESRLGDALESAGFRRDAVGRIDGNVPVVERQRVLKSVRVLIATPDVIHAWFLSSLSDPNVIGFLRNLKVIIADEIHSYSGVFGSNSAYLFRRLRYCLAALNATPRFIAASATVASPDAHLEKLFGVSFGLVPQEMDTSPRYASTVFLVTPAKFSDLLTETAVLLQKLATTTDSRFIVFVDSRKMSEHLAAIAARRETPAEEPPEEDPDERVIGTFEHLDQFSILPFRAGYEQRDRERIQSRLTNGTLRGVVSTSALELGIDIPHLDCGVLLGVPRSATSLMQRIGRVGRRVPGCILIVNTGTLHDEAVFRKPDEALNRPYAEAPLYLENRRIQYIHALCLARHGGEHDQICESAGLTSQQALLPKVEWPQTFAELAEKERLGEIEPDLQSMKIEAGDNPNYAFPLRDVESQFQVEEKTGTILESRGSLSFSQVLREAYPGAVYYYTTLPHRVARVDVPGKRIHVWRTKRYFTSPSKLPTLVYPNLSAGNVFVARDFPDGLTIIEANVQIREAISGYVERRGQTKTQYSYPISPVDSMKSGITFRASRFTRNFFTTGLVIAHAAMLDANASVRVAELMYEAFLTLVPFERQDVNFAVDRHRATRPPYAKEGGRFLAIYDQTYGSLRLTSRLSEPDILRSVLKGARQMAVLPELQTDPAVIALLDAMVGSAAGEPNLLRETGPGVPLSSRHVKVILPGSVGLVSTKGNEEVKILAVFLHPTYQLCYKVEYDGMVPATDLTVIVPIANVVEVPGESKTGRYDYETGEVLPDL